MQDHFLNILLVEDDEVDVMTVRRVFSKIGIKHLLFVAGNGLEALEMLQRQEGQMSFIPLKNRLILLDLHVPKMDGIEFLQVLRREPELKSTPVVVFSTSAHEQDRIQAYSYNVAGYFLKPLSIDALTHTISILNNYWMMCEMP